MGFNSGFKGLILASEEVRSHLLAQLIYPPYPWNGRLGGIPRRSECSGRGKISFSCHESEGDSLAFKAVGILTTIRCPHSHTLKNQWLCSYPLTYLTKLYHIWMLKLFLESNVMFSVTVTMLLMPNVMFSVTVTMLLVPKSSGGHLFSRDSLMTYYITNTINYCIP